MSRHAQCKQGNLSNQIPDPYRRRSFGKTSDTLNDFRNYITAFQMADKIKRFTRVIFGANSAAEDLQHALRQIQYDIECACNIDIFMFVSDEGTHDIVLRDVLRRLAEK